MNLSRQRMITRIYISFASGLLYRYFEMRLAQLQVLHNLHYEIKKIRKMPKQALVIADYIMYMADYVVEMNIPDQQIEKLEEISEQMKQEELPKTREEFEGRALLYHIFDGSGGISCI
mgnify:CR=1 FL=1